MPTYEFRCRECDTVFEEKRTMADASRPAVCPDGHADTVKLLSLFAASRATAGGGAPMTGGGGCCGGGCGCH